jgi:hypothetical protein
MKTSVRNLLNSGKSKSYYGQPGASASKKMKGRKKLAASRLRLKHLGGVAIVALLGLAVVGSIVVLASHPATPTVPAGGTLNSGTIESISFNAPLRAGAASGPGDCLGPNCSDFDLFVANPGGKNVRVRIDWGLVTNDFDLYVYEQTPTGEEQVASSGAGATTFEEAVFTPKPNTNYQILIVHFASTGDNIEGVVSLVDPPVVKQPNRIGPRNTGIVFSPNSHIQTPMRDAPSGKGTVTAPETVRDGEPSIRADVRGNVYPAGIRGVPAGVDVWRFGPNAFCPRFKWHDDSEFPLGVGDPPSNPNNPNAGYVYLGQPDGIFATDGAGSPDAGGGDIELAVSFPALPSATPTLSMVSLTLANITSAASTNRGNDWTPANPFAALGPPADRQWIEAYGQNTVYLYYRTLATLTGLVLQKSIDGGITYAASFGIPNPTGYTPGWIDVDQTPNGNGSVDIYLSAQNSSELVVFHCVDPTPGLPSVISCSAPVTVDKTMSHGHIFDVVSVDSADNVYTTWSNNRDVFYAYSTNKGATWSNPIAVTNSGTGGMPTTNIFPWITAGDNGRIGIVWYGTDAPTHADNNAEWKTYYAFTANARASTPTMRWLEASDHVNHVGNISQAGFSPNETAVNRNLIDFFEVAHDPRDGAAVIAFGDDHNDFDGATYYTRQIAGPGLRANRNPTQPFCPPLVPYRNPEVIDHAGDTTTTSDTTFPGPEVDIIEIDYGSELTGGQLYLTATMKVTGAVPGPNRSYRSYFAVNTPRGLMDKGNEYFVELTTEFGAPQYFLGVKDRRNDGTTAEKRVENITADQVGGNITPGPPGTIKVRVNVNRLDYCYDGDTNVHTDNCSPRPGDGSLVIGLMGRTRIVAQTPDANPATQPPPGPTASSLIDETRGGSWIILGRRDDGGGGGGGGGGCDDDDDSDSDSDSDSDDGDCDGEHDDEDSDDDNDGRSDDDDSDDDNDGIGDLYDSDLTRETQVINPTELAAGGQTEYMMESDSNTVFLNAAVPDGQTHKIEIYNSSGVLVGSSLPVPGQAVVRVPAALPGNYTVRVTNLSARSAAARVTLVRSDRWP